MPIHNSSKYNTVMKKLFLFVIVMTLSLTGLQAQKKNVPSADGKAPQGISSVAAEKVIKLPMPEVGLDGEFRTALKNRATTRDLKSEELPMEIISSLLWSAYGFNRPEEQKRVVPSAINVQEFDIYVFLEQGIYLYDAQRNTLNNVVEGDHRAEISKQKHFAVAPFSIVIVANYDRMTKFKNTEDRDFYAAVDCGYVSQDIYLFCAMNDLGTVACGGIDRDILKKLLKIKNGKAMLAHPVGRR